MSQELCGDSMVADAVLEGPSSPIGTCDRGIIASPFTNKTAIDASLSGKLTAKFKGQLVSAEGLIMALRQLPQGSDVMEVKISSYEHKDEGWMCEVAIEYYVENVGKATTTINVREPLCRGIDGVSITPCGMTHLNG
ncbi:MAG: hypothetical protein NC311_05915 [Muribaculaceae bacterium]|nr:hypothetical protein [Muribaculaceae bacterium]